jgi:hypothetical protein
LIPSNNPNAGTTPMENEKKNTNTKVNESLLRTWRSIEATPSWLVVDTRLNYSSQKKLG